MAKTKEFEREAVLKQAIPVFAGGGYAGTSTRTLLRAMGISRQSMYDTYGDKRRLYLEALEHYVLADLDGQVGALRTDGSPMERLEALLQRGLTEAIAARACLDISATCEFGCSDQRISTINDTAADTLRHALEQCIDDAKRMRQVCAGIDAAVAARFMMTYLKAIRLAARGGATEQSLRDGAVLVMRSLK